ncbi:MAG: YvaD family protein [Leptospira sp.]|nr:YvaD family protein [Leptospira sp.]
MNTLRFLFFITDIGFIVYWIITLFHLIPDEYLFPDYRNPVTVAWNWSFFPLDMFISATGLLSIYLKKRDNRIWKNIALISLILTFCSGLQAISFWTIAGYFDISWWLPNLFLMLYPPYFIFRIAKDSLE